MWHKVCELSSLNNDELRLFEIDDEAVLLVKSSDDVYAFENQCSHMDKSLIKGKWNPERCEILCVFHKAIFDVKQKGKVIQGPATSPIKTYEVKVEQGSVFVDV